MSFLNFEPDILERIDSLSRSQDQHRKLFEELASTLADRQKLEEFYARSLERLCEGLSKIKISPASEYPKHVISILIGLFSTEAEQSSTFAASLASEVIPLLKDACKDDAQLLKNTAKTGDRHENDLFRNVNAFEAMRKQYLSHSHALISKLKQSPHLIDTFTPTIPPNPNQQIPQNIAITPSTATTTSTNIPANNSSSSNSNSLGRRQQNDSIKEQAALNYLHRSKIDSENEFEKQIGRYNKYIDEYFVDVARIEDTIVSQECAKRELLSDSMMKILVFKVSFLRSLQYDVDRVTTRLSTVDTKASIKQYLNEAITASAERARSTHNKSQPQKPLLTKLHFDHYKQHVDSSLKSTLQEQKQAEHQQQLSRIAAAATHAISPPPATNSSDQSNASHNPNLAQKQKPRHKIFANSSIGSQQQSQIAPTHQQQQQQSMNLSGVVSFERRPQQEKEKNPMQPAAANPTQARENLKENHSQQTYQQQTRSPTAQISSPRASCDLSTAATTATTTTTIDKNQLQQQNIVKKPQIKQPIDCIPIDIMKLIEAKNKRLHKDSGVVEIEREDFFEYLLLKVWHNNEVQGYDIEQLRGIVSSGGDGRNAFSEYFCSFFEAQIRASRALVIAAESNPAERILLEKTMIVAEVEINSDTYTQLMRVVYCLLDVAAQATSSSNDDVHGIARIFATAKSLFKVIRPPDENIVCFQRIYLHEGLSGHHLFANDAHWQAKLIAILDEIEDDYSHRVKLLASGASDSIAIHEETTSSHRRVLTESEFILRKLSLTVKDFVGFAIPKPRIAQMFANLTLSTDVAKDIQTFISNLNVQSTTILQTEEISSSNANSNDRNFQKRGSSSQPTGGYDEYSAETATTTSSLEQQFKPHHEDSIKDFAPSKQESSEQKEQHFRESAKEQEKSELSNDGLQNHNGSSNDSDDSQAEEDYSGNDPEANGEKKNYFLDGLS